MAKKILFGILLLLIPALCWGQVARIVPSVDSAQVETWEFLNTGDVYLLGWGMQAHGDTAKPNILQAWQDSLEKMVYEKIDSTTATVPVADDVDTTGTDIAAAIANCHAADDTVDTYREAIADTIQDHWAAFISDNNDTVTAYRAAIHDSLDANWTVFTSDDTVDTYREAIADTIADHWAAFIADNNDYPGDSVYNIYGMLTDTTWDMKTQLESKGFVILNIAAANDLPVLKFPRAITIDSVFAKCEDGTNVVGALDEYNYGGSAVDAAIDADWTITTTQYVDGSFTNAGLDAGDWLGWHTTSVSGTVTRFVLTIYYHEN